MHPATSLGTPLGTPEPDEIAKGVPMSKEKALRAWAIALHVIAIAGGVYLGVLFFGLATGTG
ncbi:hypothetical protein Skr01_72150 [Sphaerisporangium krabiense]|nr:hypothetical protein Skr01_72150 [Sphaerisporangium krabiense]